jgi:hypothetical protein
MTSEHPNQREFTRVLVSARTELRSGAVSVSGAPTHSLSMKGMSVVCQERLPVGSECEIDIVLVEGEVTIQLLGTVVSLLPDGMAVQFTKILGLESFDHLRNLVFYNAPDVDAVEQEFSTHSGLRKREG